MSPADLERLLHQHLDDELVPCGFRLTSTATEYSDHEMIAAVYEADPDDFGERYPALDGRAGGNDRCVDLWIHFDPSTGLITAELEGSSPEDLMAKFRIEDPAGEQDSAEEIDSQLRLLSRRFAAILDAARVV